MLSLFPVISMFNYMKLHEEMIIKDFNLKPGILIEYI